MKKTKVYIVIFILFLIACTAIAEELPWKINKQKETGTLLLTDIHFDPFVNGTATQLVEIPISGWQDKFEKSKQGKLPGYGEDTNYRLFSSTLQKIKSLSSNIDCAIVCGDFICHGFERKYIQYCGAGGSCPAFAVKTIEFVAAMIQQALPGKPVFFVMGNNDSDNGDYNIIPGGLMLKELSGFFDNISANTQAKSDFANGGYYKLTFPGAKNEELIVLNDTFWHGYYNLRQGTQTIPDDEMRWLKNELDDAAKNGEKVLIAMHIPPGVDAYLAAKDKNCISNDGFLKQVYNNELVEIMKAHSSILKYSFAGHSHFNDFRVFADKSGRPFMATTIIPSISPVHGNNPAFEIALMEKDGGIKDMAVYNLNGFGTTGDETTARWQLEYTFSGAYGYKDYSPENLNSLAVSMAGSPELLDKFLLFYTAGNQALSSQFEKNSRIYECVLTSPDFGAYSSCACDKK